MVYIWDDTTGINYLDYAGSDRLAAIGRGGNDYIWGNTQNDSIRGDAGNDTLKGYSGNDYLFGGDDNDQLYGEADHDKLYGERGNDLLDGSVGNDTLDGYGRTGASEFDTLFGGAGYDTFVLGDNSPYGGVFYNEPGDGYAIIADWNSAEDWIQVRGSVSQYNLKFTNVRGSSALDTEIYYGSERIGLVQDSTDVSFSRDFKFV